MNSLTRNLLAAALCVLGAACDAGAKGKAQCDVLKAPVSSAKVLNAIGAGQIQSLVDCGLKPDADIPVDGASLTPLQFAASSGRADLVRQVIKAGANPNYPGGGDTPLPPLEVALSASKYEAATALLEAGADAGYVLPRTRMTALMSFAFDERPGAAAGMTKVLVAKGAQVNGVDAKGNSALHWAARAGNGSLVEALLSQGADACVRNQKSERPADVAKGGDALKQRLASACNAQPQAAGSR